MQISSGQFKVPYYWISLGGTLLLTLFFLWMYFKTDINVSPKLPTLYAGLSTGFLIAFLQLCVAVLEAIKLTKYESMGVLEIRENRREEAYYKKLIQEAKSEIKVVGVTASRFMEDFGNDDNASTKALINALARGVVVKILIPKHAHQSAASLHKVQSLTIPLYENLRGKYPDNIFLKYFDHIAAQSMVSTDDICIVGPVFGNKESKFTPSIVLTRNSTFAQPYFSNFESEWSSASDEP
ncbi:MAG: hypothetical protein Q8L20_04440 [Gammaproteobacteria bacterium]|nr:hypothetical protein [Gammaproteobacteria bacterium]